MKQTFKIFLPLVVAFGFSSCQSDSDKALTGPELIEKSIEFHDPKGNWGSFEGTFVFQDSLPPGRDSRFYKVTLDNSKSKMKYWIEGLEYEVIQDSVSVLEGEVEDARALRMRNYYTYLWGLPMKLQDQGTQIDSEVDEEEIKGKTYKVVRVPYEEDIWYFYLDPETYQMEAYKFYKDEPNQVGEIIYLEGLTEAKGMKIPSNRTWYRTEKPEFLGTDQLKSVE